MSIRRDPFKRGCMAGRIGCCGRMIHRAPSKVLDMEYLQLTYAVQFRLSGSGLRLRAFVPLGLPHLELTVGTPFRKKPLAGNSKLPRTITVFVFMFRCHKMFLWFLWMKMAVQGGEAFVGGRHTNLQDFA